MISKTDKLREYASQCMTQAEVGINGNVGSIIKEYLKVLDSIHESWSGSFLGHHSLIYLKGFRAKRGGEYFDSEWGTLPPHSSLSQTTGPWVEFSKEDVEEVIKNRSHDIDIKLVEAESEKAVDIFEKCKEELISCLDLIRQGHNPKIIDEIINDVKETNSYLSINSILNDMKPSQVWSRDSLAVQGGIRLPPHLYEKARMISIQSSFFNCKKIAKLSDRLIKCESSIRILKPDSIEKFKGSNINTNENYWNIINPFWLLWRFFLLFWRFKVWAIIIGVLSFLAIDFTMAFSNIKVILTYIKQFNK